MKTKDYRILVNSKKLKQSSSHLLMSKNDIYYINKKLLINLI